MPQLFLAALFVLAASAQALAAPRLTLSAYQITPGMTVEVRASGFTPHGIVISELIRPDGTEYPTMTFEADGEGDFTHVINIIPTIIGTYEVRMTDRTSRNMISTHFMFVAPGSALPAPPTGETLPALLTGVWQGLAAQTGSGESAPVLLSLSGGAVGAIVGTIAYPSLLCGGEVWLAGANGDSAQLGETIAYGEERCAGRGLITLRRAADGSVSFSWHNMRHKDGDGASGTLRRR